ncbi:hypothetical protein QW131_07370 [Roseibium salinum]|nr:hypothetical protein [Roseibium salinum]
MGLDDFSELLGKSDLELHPQEVSAGFISVEAEVMTTGVAKIDLEEFVILPNGKRKWFFVIQIPGHEWQQRDCRSRRDLPRYHRAQESRNAPAGP